MAKMRVNFTIEEDVMAQFKAFCEEHHHKMSSIVEKLIRAELSLAESHDEEEAVEELRGIM